MNRRALVGRILVILVLPLCVCGGAGSSPVPGGPATAIVEPDSSRSRLVEMLMERSRLLEDVHFAVTRDLWETYIRETTLGGGEKAPVGLIAEEGNYHLTVPIGGAGVEAAANAGGELRPTLEVMIRVRVFDRAALGEKGGLGVLSSEFAWEDVRVDGKATTLATVEGWLRYAPGSPSPVPAGAGPSSPVKGEVHVITAKAALKESAYSWMKVGVPRTVRTLVRFDSPGAWEVWAREKGGARTRVMNAPKGNAALVVGEVERRRLRGTAEAGTHGEFGLAPTDKLDLWYPRLTAETRHQARCVLKGDVTWNIDAGSQQVSAAMEVGLAGGGTERIEVTLPRGAQRVEVTGPDVRRTDVAGETATVFLKGWTEGRTRLRVDFVLPTVKNGGQRLAGFGVRDGRWEEGTVVITNTAGSSEVVVSETEGLTEVALSEVPSGAAGMLAGPAVVAFKIGAQSWSAGVDVIDLGEFAVKESVADLAHYTAALTEDGSVCCLAQYEVRNRARQFLKLELPAGAKVLLARVNEKSVPLTPVAGKPDQYLLPLVRSKASITGLVSFPVEVAYLARVKGLEKKGLATLPLPRVDIPVAYAWAEAYVPEGMKIRKMRGVLGEVKEYSSKTATTMLEYGRAEYAEGYVERERPKPGTAAEEGVPVLSKIPVMGQLVLKGSGAPAVRAKRVRAGKATGGGGGGSLWGGGEGAGASAEPKSTSKNKKGAKEQPGWRGDGGGDDAGEAGGGG